MPSNRLRTTGRNFNPRAPQGARLLFSIDIRHPAPISTRAPREGRDRSSRASWTSWWNFNPRAPRGARRCPPSAGPAGPPYFNPRAPRGARRLGQVYTMSELSISTRAPREGRDKSQTAAAQSAQISTRAPREGRDDYLRGIADAIREFQPARPARGATAAPKDIYDAANKFQPARPARGATYYYTPMNIYCKISTRAPREGRDDKITNYIDLKTLISTRAPREGRD